VEAAKAPEPEPPKPAQPPPPPKTQPPVAKKSGPSRPETAHDKLLSRTQQMVRERPEDGAKLLRTILVGESEPEGGGAAGDESAPPVMQKVAILMVALGQETAAEMMKFLSDFEIEEITKAVVNLKNVTTQMQDRVLEEFRQHLEAGEWVSQGGMDFARNVLERAVGPRKAQEILERVSRSVSSGFYMLKNVAPEQVAPFIAHEHPQTIALILSQLDAARSGGILDQLPARLQADVSYRMATMESITPAVLKDIEEALEASLRDILGGNQDVGGPGVVADMLNMSGSSTEKNVLDQIDAQDPEISESIARLMFTFDDIVKLTDREMQVLLRVVDQKDLVIALKAAQEALKDKILGNLSEQTRQALTEEMEFIGPMRLSEVEEVQQRIVQQVRQLEENGEITIVRGDADDSFV
jgi:flagellar motor switch protein FliG